MKTLKNKMTWQSTEGIKPEGPSLTIPDDSLPISHVLIRFAHGINIPRGSGQYGDVEDDEHDSYDLGKLDALDLTDLTEIGQERIALLQAIESNKAKPKEEKKEEGKIEPEPQ